MDCGQANVNDGEYVATFLAAEKSSRFLFRGPEVANMAQSEGVEGDVVARN